MRYDTDHKQKTRERVLAVAAKQIRADGPHRIGVAAVMSKAGLTHGGFYAHFDSKDALVTAAIEHMFESASGRVARSTDNQPPAKGLAAYIDFYLSVGHRDAIATGCPIVALVADLPRLARPARKGFTDGVARLTKLLSATLEQLGHSHSEEEASSVIAELIGALALARAEPDDERSKRILDMSRRRIKSRLGLDS